MTDRISFVVPGAPVPWQRTVLDGRGGGRSRVVTAGATRDYQERVRVYAMQARQLASWTRYAGTAEAFSFHMRFFLADLRNRDVDNLAKSVADACNGVLFSDDGRVVIATSAKHLDRENPRAEVCVVAMERTFIDNMETAPASFERWAATR